MEKKVIYTDTKTQEKYEVNTKIPDPVNEKGYLFWNKKTSVKTFSCIPLPKVFTWSDRGRINELRHFILRDNQFLIYKSGGRIRPIGDFEMGRLFELSDRRTRELICKMKKYSVLKEVVLNGIKYYAFNPLYGLKDKRISVSVFIFFQDELRDHLPSWVFKKMLSYANEIKPNVRIIK